MRPRGGIQQAQRLRVELKKEKTQQQTVRPSFRRPNNIIRLVSVRNSGLSAGVGGRHETAAVVIACRCPLLKLKFHWDQFPRGKCYGEVAN